MMMNKGPSQDCLGYSLVKELLLMLLNMQVKEGSLLTQALGRLDPQESPAIQL